MGDFTSFAATSVIQHIIFRHMAHIARSIYAGLDFDPIAVTLGFIYINHLDYNMVTGDFHISLDDAFNGSKDKSIIGDFGINFQ